VTRYFITFTVFFFLTSSWCKNTFRNHEINPRKHRDKAFSSHHTLDMNSERNRAENIRLNVILHCWISPEFIEKNRLRTGVLNSDFYRLHADCGHKKWIHTEHFFTLYKTYIKYDKLYGYFVFIFGVRIRNAMEKINTRNRRVIQLLLNLTRTRHDSHEDACCKHTHR